MSLKSLLLQFAFTGVCDEKQVKHLVSYKRCQSIKSRAYKLQKSSQICSRCKEGAGEVSGCSTTTAQQEAALGSADMKMSH